MCVFLPQHTRTVFGKGSSFLAFPSWSCRPKDPKAAELDFRGFLMTKVSTTWLHYACCLRKLGQWPAVTRKRTRPQHFKTSAVRKCAKKLFWPALTKSLPLHTPPCPTSPPPPAPPLSVCPLYAASLLLAHSDLMQMRFVAVDQRRSCRRDKNKPVESCWHGQAGEAVGWSGGSVGGLNRKPSPSTSSSSPPSYIASACAGFRWQLSAE